VDALVSAEDAGVYKPHPGIYQYLLATMKTGTPATLLVSSNPFDLIGASAAGLRTAWCKRQPSALFDPWGSPPDHVITGLDSLAGLLSPASC
jgi:2-haloacid dehalogenase